MSRKSKAEYIGEKRPSAAPARPTSSPNCRASALSGELDRGHAGGGMGAFRPTPWLRPRGRPCALHHPVRSPLRPNAEYSNQQLLADVWCYPVGTAFHRRPYHVTAPVGTAFHRRPRLAVERQPYLTDQTLQRVVSLYHRNQCLRQPFRRRSWLMPITQGNDNGNRRRNQQHSPANRHYLRSIHRVSHNPHNFSAYSQAFTANLIQNVLNW